MKVLFDIVHPADVLFFCRPIQRLKENGAEIVVASRHKDITVEILDAFGIPHQPISRAGAGMAGLLRELVGRDARLFRLARRERPDVMAGFGGVAISHVGAMLGIPSLAFYDSEHASLQIRLTLPFISEWHVPRCWTGREAPGRTYRFDGTKELSYLHPDRFSPDPEIARRAGWVPGRDNFLVRTVAWTAAHDRGRRGLAADELERLVASLAGLGAVHLVAEGPVPASLEVHRYRGRPQDIHHLAGQCRLYVGESATMAAEAAVLGVPAIFTAEFELGYIAELSARKLIRIEPNGIDAVLGAVAAMLAEPAASWRARRDRALDGKTDIAEYVVERIEAAAARRRNGRPLSIVRASGPSGSQDERHGIGTE